jgi:hypothetical protein
MSQHVQQKQALIRTCDTSHWRSIVGLTLNLKQSFVMEHGGFVPVDELMAKKAFKQYMNILNRRIYGAAHRRYGKQIKVVPILEKSASGRWHYHTVMEPPDYMPAADFGALAMNTWLNTSLGYGHGQVSLNVDEGWTDYIVKFRTKAEFDNYLDCIDTNAFNNQTAGA